MHYKSSGSGQAFFFQHGLGSQLTQAQNTLAGLSGAQVISADCPGHGQQILPADQAPSFEYYADYILALQQQLQLSPAIFGGISMGSGIACNIAIRYPERVKALVLVRPAWLDQGDPENLILLLRAASFLKKENGKELFEQEQDYLSYQTLLPQAAVSLMGVFADTQQATIGKVLERMVQDRPFSNLEDLQKIKVPVLVIGNEDDVMHPFFMAEAINQAIPGSKLVKVISRYLDNEQHQKQVLKEVQSFMESLK